jgi:DnaJ-class molecular chaperone
MSVTEAEAIERILKGDAFRPCMHCDGMGTTPASRQRYENARLLHEQSTPRTRTQLPNPKDYTQLCMRCKGAGMAIEENYAQACQVLGRKPPTPKLTYEMLVGRIQDKALANMRETLNDFYLYRDALIEVGAPKDPDDDR